MSNIDLHFPNGGSIQQLAAFSKRLADFPKSNEILIGASHITFLRPTCLIMLAKACRTRVREHEGETVKYLGLQNLKYANNLGFADALNLVGKPFPQGAFGGQNYIPMSIMKLESLENRASELGKELGDAIEERCENIAKIVSQDRSVELRTTIARSFCEIFRNSFEHGSSESAVFCAQYYPQLNEVEICIADRGIGVRESLLESKYTKPKTDTEAISFSLMPGVSSKAWKHKKKKASQKSVWDNAGYGLFFAHQLFGKLGHFFLASGDSSIYLTKDKYQELPCSVEGTLVSMRMSLADEDEIVGALKATREKAAEIKARLGVKSLHYKSVQAFLRSGE